MDTDKLLSELKTLAEEGNNGDYYLNGYISADSLQQIINKYLDPDFDYYNPHWGKSPTVDRELTEDEKRRAQMFRDIYSTVIKQQLEQSTNFINLFKKD